ncbi:PTS glucitol/sorbitol transporter subunit IIC [Eubacteriaceae bacterium ES3]|nr:PTS glucitol/sorbitol transporter subunit IIC [Eubacteriaceae bacterium ES3]
MNLLADAGEKYYGLFQEGAEFLLMYLEKFLPVILLLIMLVNVFRNLLGQERIEKLLLLLSSNVLSRWTLFPIFSVILLGTPGFLGAAALLKNRQKAAFLDAAVSFSHPATGLFPSANRRQLFIFLGIGTGVYMAGYDISFLAIAYFVTGLIVMLFRSLITRIIVEIMTRYHKNKEV